MFTGIVEEAGVVEDVKPVSNAIQLTVRAQKCARGLKVGNSLAVNGCCLTVVELKRRAAHTLVRFDLLEETWRRTNLQFAKRGTLVNLERPLRAGGEFGGHFVTGHIDGLGRITRWERVGRDYMLEIAAPPELMRYVVFKGSVAIDGISLTVAGVTKRTFLIWIIPHTFEVTNLQQRKAGDAVNVETDLIGKYIEKFTGPYHRHQAR